MRQPLDRRWRLRDVHQPRRGRRNRRRTAAAPSRAARPSPAPADRPAPAALRRDSKRGPLRRSAPALRRTLAVSGATRSIAALARPVSGMARGSTVSPTRAPFVRDCLGQAPRSAPPGRARGRPHRPAIEPDRPAVVLGLDVDLLPEALHDAPVLLVPRALEQPRRKHRVDHAHDRDDRADLRPSARAKQVGVDDRDAEEEDRQAAEPNQRVNEQPSARDFLIHRHAPDQLQHLERLLGDGDRARFDQLLGS